MGRCQISVITSNNAGFYDTNVLMMRAMNGLKGGRSNLIKAPVIRADLLEGMLAILHEDVQII